MKPLKNPQLYICQCAIFMFTTENASAGILCKGELFVKLGMFPHGHRAQILTSHGIREIYISEDRAGVVASSTKQ